jgi:hypothetical protein
MTPRETAADTRYAGTSDILERRRLEFERTGKITPESRRHPPADTRSTVTRVIEQRARGSQPVARPVTRVPLDLNGVPLRDAQGALRSLKELDEAIAARDGKASTFTPAQRAEFERLGVTPPAERPTSRAGWTRYERAFDSYVRTGVEHRDMGEATGAGGGYLVPTAFSDSCYVGLSYQSALWSKAAIWKSANGAPAQYPAIACRRASRRVGRHRGKQRAY